MNGIQVINTVEELSEFRNDKGVVEIVVRRKNKRIKAFQKVVVSTLAETQEKKLAEGVTNALSDITKLSERNLNLLGSVAKLQGVGLLLNGLNLCATCAGFAIMFKKLDDMSGQLAQKIDQVHSTIRINQDIQNSFEFNKVLADHTDMLDRQRLGNPYPESKMRELVDREYSVLDLLVRTLREDVSEDQGALIFSIISLLSMLAVSLRRFDELYYFNNRRALEELDGWHLSHDKWMGVFDTLRSSWFAEKLQDHGFFEMRLPTVEVDVYYISLLDQVADLKEEVEDNQKLLVATGNQISFVQLEEQIEKDVEATIEAAYREVGVGLDWETVDSACRNAMHQAAMV